MISNNLESAEFFRPTGLEPFQTPTKFGTLSDCAWNFSFGDVPAILLHLGAFFEFPDTIAGLEVAVNSRRRYGRPPRTTLSN